MKQRTWDEIQKIWEEYVPLGQIDPLITKIARGRRIPVLERMTQRTIETRGIENALRDSIQGFQGTDIADFFWNAHNWDYLQRQPEKQRHLYRFTVVTGYFMEQDKIHPEMKNAVKYADKFM